MKSPHKNKIKVHEAKHAAAADAAAVVLGGMAGKITTAQQDLHYCVCANQGTLFMHFLESSSSHQM